MAKTFRNFQNIKPHFYKEAGGIDAAGNMYCSAEMAPQIAGAIAALPLNKAITYKELEDIVNVTAELSDTEIREATTAGSFVLFKDTDPETFEVTVKVERGINTFTSFTAEAGEKLRKRGEENPSVCREANGNVW